MILKFPRKKYILDFGASSSENQCPGRDSGLISADSTTPNLTSGSTPSVEEYVSYQCVTAILPLKIPSNEKHVLTVLAFHANELGESWCGVPLLAKECCASERHIQKMLRRLSGRGLIIPTFRHGRSTVYNIPLLGGDNGVTIGGEHAFTQNDLLNAGDKCSPKKCGKWHKGCTAIRPPYIIGVSKKKMKIVVDSLYKTF